MHLRHPLPGRRLRRPLAALAAVALATTMLGATSGAAAPSPPDPRSPSSDKVAAHPERVAAERALTRVERMFEGRTADRNATLALRDLWLARTSLTGADRAEAGRLLARPTDGTPEPDWAPKYGSAPAGSICSASVCLHWVETGEHAVADDGNIATVPGYVDQTLAELEHIAGGFTDAGYRPVKSDGTLGGNAKPDVYLADIGSQRIYGYCTSDAPSVDGVFDIWAYCVLDNDYSAAEFPTNTPLENMQVTAAHEFFHAVQYGYDAAEDGWLMEATAAWVEDEFYDDVNDNLQYLRTGPLAHPDGPLDYFEDDGGFHYGTWIFFRFLSERFTEKAGELPTIVRDIWRRADAAPGSAYGDEVSIQAVQNVLRAHGTSLTAEFSLFSVANRFPTAFYEEAVENDYPAAPNGSFRKSGKWYVTKLNHLSSATAWTKPRKGQKKAKVVVDLAPTDRGSAAIVTVHFKAGSLKWWPVRLNGEGNGAVTVPANKSVAGVHVTLVNASTRSSECWVGGPFSCSGYSKDDGLAGKLRIVAK